MHGKEQTVANYCDNMIQQNWLRIHVFYCTSGAMLRMCVVAGSPGSSAVVGQVLQDWEPTNETTAAFLLAAGDTNTAGKYCPVDQRGGIQPQSLSLIQSVKPSDINDQDGNSSNAEMISPWSKDMTSSPALYYALQFCKDVVLSWLPHMKHQMFGLGFLALSAHIVSR